MATTRYRLSIPMDLETKHALDRLASARGTSVCKTAGQFLDEMRPQLLILAEVLERVKTDPVGAMQQLNAAADVAKADLDEKQQGALQGIRGELQRERVFQIEDLSTGEQWCLGLTWTGASADRALEQAKKVAPGREWILREVGA